MKPNIKGSHHDHIDGSAAVMDVIDKCYQLSGRKCPHHSRESWISYFHDVHIDIVERFSTITKLLQTREVLELMGYAYGKRRAQEGYVYLEPQFAPQYHVHGGLSIHQATSAMVEGLKRAEREFGIATILHVSIGREAEPKVGVEVARVALDYDGELVLDLACDEASHPPEKHLPAYRMTFGTKVRRDCHAGEWVSAEPSATYEERLTRNIRTALFDLRCHGISHAITLAKHPDLVQYVVDKNIRISWCPLSNRQTNLIQNVGELGIGGLLDRGVCGTLNADDDLFLPPMCEVIEECDQAYHFTPAQCKQLEDNVFQGAFGPQRATLQAPR